MRIKYISKACVLQLLFFFTSFLWCFSSFASPGDLDTSFGGGDGYVVFEDNVVDITEQMEIDEDGNHVILTLRYPEGPTMVKYDQDGNLDTPFASQGIPCADEAAEESTGCACGSGSCWNSETFECEAIE